MGVKTRVAGGVVGWIILFVALVFVGGAVSLGYKAFFGPKEAAVERNIYEETQSYVHGKIQDLAKYKREYDSKTDPTERQAIQTLINQQFAQFDSAKVKDPNLRAFLVQMRGF